MGIRRPQEGHALKGYYDDVSVNSGEEPDTTRVLTLIREVRKCLQAVDQQPVLEFLTEDSRRYYEAREITLQRQESMVQQFFGDLQRFSTDLTRTLTTEFQEKQKTLEDEHAKRLSGLDLNQANPEGFASRHGAESPRPSGFRRCG